MVIWLGGKGNSNDVLSFKITRKLYEENVMSFLYVISAHCRPRVSVEAVCHTVLAYVPYSV